MSSQKTPGGMNLMKTMQIKKEKEQKHQKNSTRNNDDEKTPIVLSIP